MSFKRSLQALSCVLVLALLSASQAAEPAQAAPESPILAELAQRLAANDGQALAEFWKEVERRSAPLIEPVAGSSGEIWVTFLFRAPAGQAESNVRIFGELGEIDKPVPTAGPLIRLAGSDVEYRTYRMSSRARFSYQLGWPQGRVPDPRATAATAVDHGQSYDLFPDPLNRQRQAGAWTEHIDGLGWSPEKGLGWNEDEMTYVSYASGPDAPSEPFIAARADTPRGRVVTMELSSAHLGNRREISIYTSPGFDQGCAQCDFLLLFDRSAYLTAVPTPTILDNMRAEGLIRPIVAVLVGNAKWPARSLELPPSEKFQAFLREELLPWVRARYRFSRDPRRAVVAGSSFGGLAAAYTAFVDPRTFGNVLSQSGSYWWSPQYAPARHLTSSEAEDLLSAESGWLGHQYAATPKRQIRFYMDVGVWEGRVMNLPNRMFRDVLQAKGYEVSYHELVSGHDYVAWRSTLSDGLLTLLGTQRASH